jgi:hypothetical protein
VQENSRRVDDAARPGRGPGVEGAGGGGHDELGRAGARGTPRAPARGRLTEGFFSAGSPVTGDQNPPGIALEEAVHGGRP